MFLGPIFKHHHRPALAADTDTDADADARCGYTPIPIGRRCDTWNGVSVKQSLEEISFCLVFKVYLLRLDFEKLHLNMAG